MDIKQVWFPGAHSDVGGGYKPDTNKALLADIPLKWMIKAARKAGLTIEGYLDHDIHESPLATIHKSRRSFYRVKKKYYRPIEHKKDVVRIHLSVRERWEQDQKYRPANLKAYLDENGWPNDIVT